MPIWLGDVRPLKQKNNIISVYKDHGRSYGAADSSVRQTRHIGRNDDSEMFVLALGRAGRLSIYVSDRSSGGKRLAEQRAPANSCSFCWEFCEASDVHSMSRNEQEDFELSGQAKTAAKMSSMIFLPQSNFQNGDLSAEFGRLPNRSVSPWGRDAQRNVGGRSICGIS